MPIAGGQICHPSIGSSYPNPPAAYNLLPMVWLPFSSFDPVVVGSLITLTNKILFPFLAYLITSNSKGAKKPSCVPHKTPLKYTSVL